ncbi:unnamed protein product [Adineta steineri]|uniref:Protein kinase domain-containing protein n=1 Tax=Adineta steineri TaxID=433720 RepID=A0A819TP83_9BILA|nr:unnamed protein product [Adineta steineri]CAF4076431.1 unnamed protein product [Adineta steineri]
MMIDVAYAMTYLHEKNVIHADLKSDNILLRSDGTALLSDFGLSKVIEDSSMHHSYTGAIRWLSPELCGRTPERCSFMSDGWAYGCVLLEIITKKLPWEKLYESNDDVMHALSNERNARIFQEFCYNQEAPDNFRRNLRACCAWSKMNRPNFAKIVNNFYQTPMNDDQIRKERNNTFEETETSHFQRPRSAPRRPQGSFEKNNRQQQIEHSNTALYDSRADTNNEFYSSSSSAQFKYAGHTPFPRKLP